MNMTRISTTGVLLALGLSLSACAGDPAAEQARGFKPGTEAYGNCRLKLKEIRAQQDAKNANSPFHFGVGVGVSKGF